MKEKDERWAEEYHPTFEAALREHVSDTQEES